MRSELVLVLAFASASCSSGCDGERAHKTTARPHVSTSGGDASFAVPVIAPGDAAAELASAPSFLDAPAGSLDHLFNALAAAERRDTNARVELAFFGDSHTAGDSMTSRLRATWQARFG